VLLSEVIEDPKLNNKDHLLLRANELKNDNLSDLRAKAKDVIEDKREMDEKKIKKEFKVK
jgi:hypothetical protein